MGDMAMRFEKADNLLQLALEMQAARQGLSLQNIKQRIEVDRRTAQLLTKASCWPDDISYFAGELRSWEHLREKSCSG